MRIVAIAVAICISTSAFAKDTLLCIPDYQTGYRFDKDQGKWLPQAFNDGNKYILWRKDGQLVWSVFGKPATTDPVCAEFGMYGFSQCDSVAGNVILNRKKMRFQIIYEWGYVQGGGVSPKLFPVEGTDAPYIEIGTCSPL